MRSPRRTFPTRSTRSWSTSRSPNGTTLLLGFAYKRTIGLSPAEAKTTARRWLSYWLDQLAVVHARYIARCLYNRASACKDAGNIRQGGDCRL